MIFGLKDDAVDDAVRQKLGQFYYIYEGMQQVMECEGVLARMPMTFVIQ